MKEGKGQSGLVVALTACCLFAGTPLLAQEPSVAAQAPAEQLQELETVVVYGGYAMPQMWKISKGGHVLWLLSIGAPAPAGVQWRSDQLEARVAESQLVLYASKVIGVRYKESNQRFARMVDGVYLFTPAAGFALLPLVDKAAKKYKVKVRTMPDVERDVELTKAEAEILHTKNARDPGGEPCFIRRLYYLERLIKDGDQQAKAAAQTDAARPAGDSCISDWLTGGKLPDPAVTRSMVEKNSLQWKLGWQQLDAEWMAGAQDALAKNKSTFAVQETSYFSRVNSYIAKFRELGYEVEPPSGAGE